MKEGERNKKKGREEGVELEKEIKKKFYFTENVK